MRIVNRKCRIKIRLVTLVHELFCQSIVWEVDIGPSIIAIGPYHICENTKIPFPPITSTHSSPPIFLPSFLFPFLPSLPHKALSFARYFFFLPTQQKYDYIIFLVLWQPNEITILLFYGIKKEKFTMEVNLCCALYNIIILLLNIFSHSHLYNES